MKFYIKTLLLLPVFFLVPALADASSAVQLDDRSALFTIDFSIEDDKFENSLPIMTKVNGGHNEKIDEIGYVLQRESESANEVESIAAIVLGSDATIVDGKYEVAAGTPATFTLLIVATFKEDLQQDYRAVITKIPYWLDGRRTMVHQNQLDELDMPVLEVE